MVFWRGLRRSLDEEGGRVRWWVGDAMGFGWVGGGCWARPTEPFTLSRVEAPNSERAPGER